MPQCYPDEPDFQEGRSAEQRLWEALREQLPPEAALFHSVNLLEDNREHEIDLLVSWPGVGLAAIEVKGGHVTRTAQGWQQESAGRRRPIGSPVLQIQDAKKVLTRMLGTRTSGAGRARAVHLVGLPFTGVPSTWEASDLTRGCLLDSSDMQDAATRVRAAIEAHGSGHQPLSEVDHEAVVRVLAGELLGQTSLLSEAEEHQYRVDRLTQDQLRVLQNLHHYRRLKVIGGGGYREDVPGS